MDPKQLAEKFMQAFESDDYATCLDCLASDFKFSGPMPKPLSGEEWMGVAKGMRAAFPDLNYNLKVTGVEGNQVMTSTQLTGTHSGDWDLSAIGMEVLPASGRSFSNPEEHGVLTVEGDKISAYEVGVSEGGGLGGVLAQLGVQLPGS